MLSKRSFFNPTLFKKNLSRSWPLWGGVAAVGCLVPLYMLLALITEDHLYLDGGEFAGLLYPVAVYFVPAAAFGYAILVAMVVWSYLYNARSVGLMHTLPIHRTNLFVTNTLSGFAMLLIPYVAVGGFVCILALCWGFMDFGAVVTTVAAVLLLTVLFFGIATFCAMVTGNVFALPVFYLVVNFAAPALDMLFSLLSNSFLVGVSSEYTGVVEFLSPLVQIYHSFEYKGTYVSEGVYEHDLSGFGVVALYGLAGVVFFALAWLLYQRRASESAGNVVAFRWLRPLFRFGVALVFALTTGQALYAIIWGSIFQQGDYADVAPMAACMAVTGLVGYYAASMLLDKTLRVFRGSLPGAAVAVCAAAVLCFGASVDVLGIESYVPEMDELDSVYFYTSDMVGNTPNFSVEDSPELVEKVLALHSAIVSDLDRVRPVDSYTYEYVPAQQRQECWQRVSFTYTMTDGSTVRRNYSLLLARDSWDGYTGYEGAFRELFAGTQIQLHQVQAPADGLIGYVHAYCYEDDRASYKENNALDEETLYQAILADAREGNLYDYDLFDDYYNDNYPVSLELEFRIRSADSPYEGYDYDYRSVELRPTMVHTVENLLEQGFITEEDLARWNEERDITGEIAEKYGLVRPVIGITDGPTSVYVTG